MIRLKQIVEQTYEPIKVGASRLADTQHPDTEIIPQDKITSELSKVGAKEWTAEVNEKGIVQIKLDRKFENYKKTVKFINDVVKISEKMDHHADIAFTYDTATVTIFSHSHNAITNKDIEFADAVSKK